MTNEEKREQIIQGIADMLRHTPFIFEYKVKKKPTGMKVICEVTQEQLGKLIDQARKEKNEVQNSK